MRLTKQQIRELQALNDFDRPVTREELIAVGCPGPSRPLQSLASIGLSGIVPLCVGGEERVYIFIAAEGRALLQKLREERIYQKK